MKAFPLIFALLFCNLLITAQPLTNGMGIITHWTGASGEWNAFSIYDTENNAAAPLGLNWATNFYTPADATIADSWKGTNMGDVFGLTIDNQRNVYFAATKAISSSGSTGTNPGTAGDGGSTKWMLIHGWSRHLSLLATEPTKSQTKGTDWETLPTTNGTINFSSLILKTVKYIALT